MQHEKLRVLVIHDSDLVPATAAGILKSYDFELCEITRMNGSTESYVRDWETVMEVLQGDAVVSPLPDLLLIDSKYEKDFSAPPIHRPHTSGTKVADPRGILYGVTMAAYLSAGEQRPLGFALYSMALEEVADDPYAQTFYGLLAALGGEAQIPANRGVVFQAEMANTPAGGQADDVWPKALEKYRLSLQSHLGRRLTPDYESFALAMNAVRQFLAGTQPDIPADLSVGWTGVDARERKVLLSSLFADCRKQPLGRWDVDSLRSKGALEALEGVTSGRWRREAARKIVVNLSTWYGSQSPWSDHPEQPAEPWSGSDAGRWERAVAFIALRAMNLADLRYQIEETADYLEGVEDFDAKNLATFIGLGVVPGSIDRTMRRVLGHVLDPTRSPDYSPSTAVGLLAATTRWPHDWPLEVRLTAKDVLEQLKSAFGGARPSLSSKYWPKWLGEE